MILEDRPGAGVTAARRRTATTVEAEVTVEPLIGEDTVRLGMTIASAMGGAGTTVGDSTIAALRAQAHHRRDTADGAGKGAMTVRINGAIVEIRLPDRR